MRKFWKDHSLSIVLISIGIALQLISIPLAEGTWFDLVSQTGGSFFTAGIIYLLSGPFRERNKPEDKGK